MSEHSIRCRMRQCLAGNAEAHIADLNAITHFCHGWSGMLVTPTDYFTEARMGRLLSKGSLGCVRSPTAQPNLGKGFGGLLYTQLRTAGSQWRPSVKLGFILGNALTRTNLLL